MIKTKIAKEKYVYPYVCANISNDDYTTYPVDTDGNVTQVDVIENGKLFKFITPANAKARMDKQMVDNLKVGDEATDDSSSDVSAEPVEETPKEELSPSENVPPTGGKPVNAPVDGTLLKYVVAEGASVSADTTIIMIESMKMELEIKAGAAGSVHFITPEGTQVTAGQTIAEVK